MRINFYKVWVNPESFGIKVNCIYSCKLNTAHVKLQVSPKSTSAVVDYYGEILNQSCKLNRHKLSYKNIQNQLVPKPILNTGIVGQYKHTFT
jgi:hypothetical protein